MDLLKNVLAARHVLIAVFVILAAFSQASTLTEKVQNATLGALATSPIETQISNPFADFSPDLFPFRERINDILVKSKILTQNTSTTCALPDGAIIFTLCNYHVLPLLALRKSILERTGLLNCLEQRMITVCLDAKCQKQCIEEKLPNCVELTIPPTVLAGYGHTTNAHQKWSYNYMVWMKYELFQEALKEASEFFYLDADVVLFKDPFPATRFGRDQDGQSVKGEYDIMYQRERGMKEFGCGGSVNGGVMWLRNSSALHEKLFPAMWKHKDEIINVHGNDQDLIGNYVGLVRYCTLPVAQYMGHCVSSRDIRGYSVPDVVTFHTNCVAGLQTKINTIRDFERGYFSAVQEAVRVKASRAAKQIAAKTVVKHSHVVGAQSAFSQRPKGGIRRES